MKNKKTLRAVLCIILSLLMVAVCFVSCNSGSNKEEEQQVEEFSDSNILNKIFGYVLQFCYRLSGGYWGGGNYILTLVIFALLMQILLSPFGIIQQRNTIKQAKLRPKEMAIRNKYKGRNDQATLKKMQNEIMELYQKEGYSQFAGCLPMLLQLVIIFPIYRVVIEPITYLTSMTPELYTELKNEILALGYSIGDRAPQIQIAGWLQSSDNFSLLSEGLRAQLDGIAAPSASLFGIDLAATPFESMGVGGAPIWLALIPLVNLGLTYLSQFLSRKMSYQNPQSEQMNNSSMKIMMYGLPIMTLFITFMFPAAIGVYWIIRTLFSMLQQFIIHKAMPYPKFTEEDYKKAEKELKGTRKDKKSDADYVVQPGEYRSLHHIDD